MSRSGYDVTPLTKEEREEAAKGLPSMSKYVVLEHGTERPFTGKVIMDQLL
jgi:peptide-methionine (R)-S-oxide reductase